MGSIADFFNNANQKLGGAILPGAYLQNQNFSPDQVQGLQDASRQQFGMGLLSSIGTGQPFGTRLGQAFHYAGQNAQDQVAQMGRQQALQQEMAIRQQAFAEQQREQTAREAVLGAQFVASSSDPTTSINQLIASNPKLGQLFQGQDMSHLSPEQAKHAAQTVIQTYGPQAGIGPEQPHLTSVNSDARLISENPDGSATTVIPSETTSADTSDIKNYNMAQSQGYKGPFDQWLKETKRAGATTVSVDTKGANAFATALATKVADQVSSQYGSAQGAPQIIDRARRVKQLVGPNGSAITGFGAEGMGKLAAIAYAVGIKSTGNAASDTEVLGHELAASAIVTMKTLSEGTSSSTRTLLSPQNRAFLEQASSGNLNYDARTIARLADLNEQAAVESIKQWNASAGRIKKSQPGLLDSIGASEVQMPEGMQPTGGPPKLSRNPDGSYVYTP